MWQTGVTWTKKTKTLKTDPSQNSSLIEPNNQAEVDSAQRYGNKERGTTIIPGH